MKEKIKTIKDDIKNFILDWNSFPLDLWWRRKYKIPFGSQAHREMNFIDMSIEYQEELFFKELIEEDKLKEEEKENHALGLSSDKEVVKLTNEEIDNDYENLDLSQFDKT